MHINNLVFNFLNSLAKKNILADILWIFLAKYAIFFFGIALIYYVRKDKKVFLKVLIATVITVAALLIIKKLWFFPRPFENENVALLIEHRLDSTFPSKHAAVAFAIAFGIFLEKKKLGAGLLILAFFIALSRVIVGVHYPSDVFAGAVIGMIAAYSSNKFFSKK